MKKLLRFTVLILIIFVFINIYVYINIDSNYILNKNLIEQIQFNNSNYIFIEDISRNLIESVIVTEDKRFYKHFGFDILGILRAATKNIKEDKLVQGGSTITQQLAKNLFLSNEKRIDRKLKELLIAIDLEILFSKNEILEMYLNVIYYGEGNYGIGNACLDYFEKNPKELTLSESAMLAGIIKAPSIYNPKTNPELAKERQQLVLRLLQDNKENIEGQLTTIY